MTYYEVLEIDSRATTDEVERAYRRLARKVHPDLNAGDRAKAETRMKLLNEIRETLTDPLMRAGYDERLRLESQRRERGVPPPRSDEAPAVPRAAPVAPSAVRASAGDRRGRSSGLWVGLMLGGLGAGVVAVALVSSPRLARHLPDPFESTISLADAGADTAPLLVSPVRSAAARAADAPQAPPARGRARGRFVIHIGSSADDVLRALGPPDRYEPGRHPGESVLHFGRLRLEMKNGRVAGGDAAAH